MSTPDVALIVVALLFGVYGWLSSLELGISLLRLRPQLLPDGRDRQLFTPLWEITNVFLVFGFTGFAVFFNNALVRLSGAVFNILALAIGLLLFRACLVLYIYYHRGRPGMNLANGLFAACCLVIPLCFASIGVYLLSGQLFWQTASAGLLLAVVVLGLLASALSFVLLLTAPSRSTRLRNLTALFTVAFAGLGSLGLQMVLPGSLEHLTQQPFLAWALLMDVSLLYLAVVLLLNKEQWLWMWLSLVALAGPALWAWANKPYLIFPSLSVNAAYGAQAYGNFVLWATAAMAPLMLLGLALFAKLYTSQK